MSEPADGASQTDRSIAIDASAGLNLGDCCAYALAASQGLPLLYKGADFPRTDLAAA